MISKNPYWVNHALITIIISVSTFLIYPSKASLLTGFFFYLGREIRDWEKLHNWDIKGFDWPGFIAPLIATLVLLIVF